MKELFLDSFETDDQSKYGMREYQIEIDRTKNSIAIKIDGYINEEGENTIIYLDFCQGPRLSVFDSVDEKPKEHTFEWAQKEHKRTITDEEVGNIPIGTYVKVPHWVSEPTELYDKMIKSLTDVYRLIDAMVFSHNDNNEVLVQNGRNIVWLPRCAIYGISK